MIESNTLYLTIFLPHIEQSLIMFLMCIFKSTLISLNQFLGKKSYDYPKTYLAFFHKCADKNSIYIQSEIAINIFLLLKYLFL